MIPRFTLGPEGYELNLQVNVLSTALMALLLLPKARDTGTRSGLILRDILSRGYGDL